MSAAALLMLATMFILPPMPLYARSDAMVIADDILPTRLHAAPRRCFFRLRHIYDYDDVIFFDIFADISFSIA